MYQKQYNHNNYNYCYTKQRIEYDIYTTEHIYIINIHTLYPQF